VKLLKPTYGSIVLALVFALFILPIGSFASNTDSINQNLNAEHPSNKCISNYPIFERSFLTGSLDSVTEIGLRSISFCDINSEEELYIISDILGTLTFNGLHDIVKQTSDRLNDQIEDDNLRLIFYATIIEYQILYNLDDRSNYYWDKANKLVPYVTDENALGMYYFVMGNKNLHSGNYISALKSYSLALSFKNVNEETKFNIKSQLVSVSILISDYDKAEQLLTDLIRIARKNEDFRSVLYCYFDKMDILQETFKYEQLVSTCHKALSMHSTYDVDECIGYTYYMMGEGHLSLSNLDSAYYYFKMGIEVSMKNNEFKELKDNYKGMAKYYQANAEYDNARIFYQKALDEKTYVDQTNNAGISKALSDLRALQGDYKNSYLELEKYLNNQKVNNKSDLRLATKIVEDAHAYKQQAKLRIIEKERQKTLLQQILFGSIAMLLLVSVLFYFLNKNRKKHRVLNTQISARNKELGILINKYNDTISYLENFAYVTAHDLKAPIQTATSFAGLLSKYSADKFDDKELNLLESIDLSIGKLTKMIDDLLFLSKLDVDLASQEIIDLNQIFGDVKISLNTLLIKSKAKIIVESKLPFVTGHRSLIAQLFSNIIENSINHNTTKRHAVIKISSKEREDGWQIISIEDASGGIPRYMIPKLFDLFSYFGDEVNNGIGLATCKKIVKLHDGDIWADIADGIGSTIKFTLPASASNRD
jgi:signal transduction histidine kinase